MLVLGLQMFIGLPRPLVLTTSRSPRPAAYAVAICTIPWPRRSSFPTSRSGWATFTSPPCRRRSSGARGARTRRSWVSRREDRRSGGGDDHPRRAVRGRPGGEKAETQDCRQLSACRPCRDNGWTAGPRCSSRWFSPDPRRSPRSRRGGRDRRAVGGIGVLSPLTAWTVSIAVIGLAARCVQTIGAPAPPVHARAAVLVLRCSSSVACAPSPGPSSAPSSSWWAGRSASSAIRSGSTSAFLTCSSAWSCCS